MHLRKNNMVKIISILLLGLIGCCSCVCHKSYPTNFVTNSYSFAPCKSMVVSGQSSVVLTYGKGTALVAGSPDSFKHLKVYEKNGVLYFNSSNNPTQSTIIKIGMSNLRQLIVAGNATVNAEDFSGRYLKIVAKDHGSIKLRGRVGAYNITQHGSGKIDIGWLDSYMLVVDSDGPGPIILAGTVEQILAKLADHAYLDARYLRARQASIFTTDHSTALVLPIDILKAFAADYSTINYYKRPKAITVVTKNHSNVLYLDWIR